ncbi:MAG: formate dehydrogenase accessory protein FdhE [Syntrophomonadaceae bacterium]|jgi:FdhE protein
MVAKRGKLVITEDESVKQAYQKYQLMKQAVDNWQQERSSYWLNMLELAEKPPYLPIQNLPSEAIIELWQRLNCTAGIEISDKELGEIWQKIRESRQVEKVMDEEMSTRFQMAICGVAQLAARMANEKGITEERVNQAGYPRDSAVCPVCGEVTTVAVVTPPDGKRMMHCNACGFERMVKRIICLHCGNEDAKQRTYLKNEAYPGIEMVVCLLCGEYSKEIDARELQVQDYMWEDLRTLPLNFATEFWLSEHDKKDNQIH